MKEITTHYAKTHLSEILREVRDGETVIILQGGTPVGKLADGRYLRKFFRRRGGKCEQVTGAGVREGE